jgi:hypothetical protein
MDSLDMPSYLILSGRSESTCIIGTMEVFGSMTSEMLLEGMPVFSFVTTVFMGTGKFLDLFVVDALDMSIYVGLSSCAVGTSIFRTVVWLLLLMNLLNVFLDSPLDGRLEFTPIMRTREFLGSMTSFEMTPQAFLVFSSVITICMGTG